MRNRPETHSEAVSRRLAALSAELEAVRAEAASGAVTNGSTDDDPTPVAPARRWLGREEGSDWTESGLGDREAPDTHTKPRGFDYGAAIEELAADLQRQPVNPPTVPTAPKLPTSQEPTPEEPPPVPVPGRHARRRGSDRMTAPLQDGVRRVRLGPGQLAVVVLLVAAGLAVTAWWLVRSGGDGTPVPDQIQGEAAKPSGLATPAVPTGSAGAAAPSGKVTVDVTGKVRSPGIVVLGPGSRVVDAIAAAGGAKRGVDLSSLNQARELTDGEQVVVGGPPPSGSAAAAAPSGSPTGAVVNINTADLATLDTLPGVGPVTGQAIIDWRTENGGFTSVDELLEVDGIGEATLADLAPYVTI